jgi:transposase
MLVALLPPYSPDPGSTEEAFSKIKGIPGGPEAKREALAEIVTEALGTVTAQDA